MQGSGNGSMRGIIPRAMQQAGEYKKEQETRGWKYEFEVSFVEIYNEAVRDLLRSNPVDDAKHEIRKDERGNFYVSDATVMTIDPNDAEKVDGIMELAARHRSVGQTAMNERYSLTSYPYIYARSLPLYSDLRDRTRYSLFDLLRLTINRVSV